MSFRAKGSESAMIRDTILVTRVVASMYSVEGVGRPCTTALDVLSGTAQTSCGSCCSMLRYVVLLKV